MPHILSVENEKNGISSIQQNVIEFNTNRICFIIILSDFQIKSSLFQFWCDYPPKKSAYLSQVKLCH